MRAFLPGLFRLTSQAARCKLHPVQRYILTSGAYGQKKQHGATGNLTLLR